MPVGHRVADGLVEEPVLELGGPAIAVVAHPRALVHRILESRYRGPQRLVAPAGRGKDLAGHDAHLPGHTRHADPVVGDRADGAGHVRSVPHVVRDVVRESDEVPARQIVGVPVLIVVRDGGKHINDVVVSDRDVGDVANHVRPPVPPLTADEPALEYPVCSHQRDAVGIDIHAHDILVEEVDAGFIHEAVAVVVDAVGHVALEARRRIAIVVHAQDAGEAIAVGIAGLLAGVVPDIGGKVVVQDIHAGVNHGHDHVRVTDARLPRLGRVDVGAKRAAGLPLVVQAVLLGQERIVRRAVQADLEVRLDIGDRALGAQLVRQGIGVLGGRVGHDRRRHVLEDAQDAQTAGAQGGQAFATALPGLEAHDHLPAGQRLRRKSGEVVQRNGLRRAGLGYAILVFHIEEHLARQRAGVPHGQRRMPLAAFLDHARDRRRRHHQAPLTHDEVNPCEVRRQDHVGCRGGVVGQGRDGQHAVRATQQAVDSVVPEHIGGRELRAVGALRPHFSAHDRGRVGLSHLAAQGPAVGDRQSERQRPGNLIRIANVQLHRRTGCRGNCIHARQHDGIHGVEGRYLRPLGGGGEDVDRRTEGTDQPRHAEGRHGTIVIEPDNQVPLLARFQVPVAVIVVDHGHLTDPQRRSVLDHEADGHVVRPSAEVVAIYMDDGLVCVGCQTARIGCQVQYGVTADGHRPGRGRHRQPVGGESQVFDPGFVGQCQVGSRIGVQEG